MAINGQENQVDWQWVGNIDINIAVQGGPQNPQGQPIPIYLPRHPLHTNHVAAIGGNTFYGSFSTVGVAGNYYHHPNVLIAHPTAAQHTEPQYFNWLCQELQNLPGMQANFVLAASAFVIEMNQTNTPCSKPTCRRQILNCVQNQTICGNQFPIVIARMSAYQIYEVQPPKICPTSREIKVGKTGDNVITVVQSMCVHKFPEVG